MKASEKLVLLVLMFVSNACYAQSLDIDEWLELFIESCVGSGSSNIVSGTVDGEVGVSLRKFDVEGNLEGEVTIMRSEYRLLSEGISNAMSEVAANQASEVRACLEPIRRTLIQLANQQLIGQAASSEYDVFILGPDEEKLLQTLATTRGVTGQLGSTVDDTELRNLSGISDIRYRQTIRMLESKGLILPIILRTLTDSGEKYVIQMGYAN